MDITSRKINAIKGALIADASALGTHWIYNQDKLAEIATQNGGAISFIDRNPDHYDNDFSYDAHLNRPRGSNTQYGEALLVAINTLLDNDGTYDVNAHIQNFAAHYGPGGTYIGYIDRATRGTLSNIAAEKTPTGTDDKQLPALASLPAIIATAPNHVRVATQLTNNNELSLNAAEIFKTCLTLLFDGQPLEKALNEAAKVAKGEFSDLLDDALDTPETNSCLYGQKTGIACNLVEAIPLSLHILKHTNSFEEAVETNNRTGGDNAGRAIVVGALAGAHYADQDSRDIPTKWLETYKDGDVALKKCEALFQ